MPPGDNRRALPPRLQLDVVLTVLHVQVPRSARAAAAPLWNHLREDLFDSDTRLRLERNGVRVGIGHSQWWNAVKATIDAIADVRALPLEPVRLPPNYPLALELDAAPREQTLFYAGDDGILTGETWPQSRNVLRLTQELLLDSADRVRLLVVPEVRQRLDGWRWVRTPDGVTREPELRGRAFTAASFVTELEPGEFLVIAPGPLADLYGLLGGAFLMSELDGQRYDSLVFLRADQHHVADRN